jgi:hypothetical protein
LEEFYTGWMKVYLRNDIPMDQAELYARQELKKHAPESSGPPWHIRLAARVLGGKQMSNAVKGTWEAVDGKKTVIGAVLVFAGVVLPEAVVLAQAVGADQVVTYLGSAVVALGVIHKLWKKFFAG